MIMVVFNKSGDIFRLDYTILQNDFFNRYWSKSYLDEDIKILVRDEGYANFEFDCGSWKSEAIIQQQLYEAFDLPHGDLEMQRLHFDAMADWFMDLEDDERDKVVVFRHFDKIERIGTCDNFVKYLLETFYETARRHLLFGNRYIILFQVDNPEYQFPEIELRAMQWNNHEWLTEKHTRKSEKKEEHNDN